MYRDAVEDGEADFYRLNEVTFIAQKLDPEGGVCTVSSLSRSIGRH